MNWRRILVPVAGAALIVAGWRAYGWPGVAVVVSGGVMWALLHITRVMHVLKQAADRPVGHVGSAVMLNAKLRPGVPLLHVMAITRSLGEQRSPKGEQPEIFRWTDLGGSHVTAQFQGGRLVSWTLWRPGDEAQTLSATSATGD